MNLFFLDSNPEAIAQAHCDQHLEKSILECVQIICTAANRHGADTPYGATHEQHSVCCWAGDSLENWEFVWKVLIHLEFERKYRHPAEYKPHWCIVTIGKLKKEMRAAMKASLGADRIKATPPALSMPIQYKVTPEDPVHCYRLFYRHECGKVSGELATWFMRGKPSWWNRYAMIDKPKAVKGDTFIAEEEE